MEFFKKVMFTRFRTRVWFLLSAVYLLSATCIVVVLFKSFQSDLLESTAAQADHRFELMEKSLGAYTETAKQHALLLSRSPQIIGYVNDISDSTHAESRYRSDVEALFSALLHTYRECFQARLINAETGLELLRLNRDSSGVAIVRPEQLQDKSDRSYFKEGLLLEPGVCYTSGFDLNREFGKLSYPYIKTMRVATPIYTGDKMAAILVLNMDAASWFEQLQTYKTPIDDLYIIDPNSGFLLHPNSEYSFSGFREDAEIEPFDQNLLEFSVNEQAQPFDELYGKNLHWLIRGKTIQEDEAESKRLVLLSLVRKDLVFESARKDTRLTFGLILLALCGGVFVLLWLSELIVKPIKDLAQTVSDSYSGATIELPKLPGDDEFAQLNNSFVVLSQKVNQQFSDLEEARLQAEKALTTKDEFLGNVSHEIRTPLNTISGMTEALKQESLSPKQKELVEALSYSVDHLLSMINDILDYNQVIEGQLKLQLQTFSPEELVRNVCLGFNQQALDHGIDLGYEVENSVPTLIEADGVRITQILHNLVVNALKFTNSGSINLKATYENGELMLTVRDTGVGMTSEELQTIFNRYQQASDGQNNKRGLGLGLSIVKYLVTLMNGRVEVASEKGKGTRFIIWIPARVVDATNGANLLSEPGKTINALYVDDVEVNRITMQHLVGSTEINLHTVANCAAAIAELVDKEIHVILMDLRMPKVDGFQCIEKIRDSYKDIPIIAVSANLGQKELNRLAAIGVNHSILKPIDPKKLLSMINSILNGRGRSVYSSLLQDHCNRDLKLLRKVMVSFEKLLDESLDQCDQQASNDNDPKKLINDIRHRIAPSVKIFRSEAILGDDDSSIRSLQEKLIQIKEALFKLKTENNL